MKKQWKWLQESFVHMMHDEGLAAHGGAAGVRDEGLLESALGRPQNLVAYGSPDVFDLASAYAFGIVRNHPFIDGNKRTGFLAAYVFLQINGYELEASEVDAYAAVIALSRKDMSEPDFAAWLRENSKKIKKS